MKVVIPNRIHRSVKERITKKTVVQSVSKRAVEYLAGFLNQAAEDIIKEAMDKSSFYKLMPIDMKRGIDVWKKKQITEVKKEYLI